MPDESVTREECLTSMQRIHQRVDEISNCSIEVKTSAKNIEKSVCEMHKIMYGSESSDGIVTKVSNLAQKVAGLFWFGGVVIVALVSALVGIFIKK